MDFLLGKAADWLAAIDGRLSSIRSRRRWRHLRALGMHVGEGVMLPRSTWIDVAHCYLISIGDRCHFGPQCLILAHDAQMDEFLDAARLGRVVIGEGCRFGARCIILCNVEIGAGCIIECGSVVATSLPAGSYCAGSPARAVCSTEDYAARVLEEARGRTRFSIRSLQFQLKHPQFRHALWEELGAGTALVEREDGQGGRALHDRFLSE
jgi:maltose O-acetyltransferase